MGFNSGFKGLMATSEDDLQKMAYHLNLIARKYNMIISSTKQNPWQCGGTKYREYKL